MKTILLLLTLSATVSFALAGETNTNAFTDPQMEKLFQRYLSEIKSELLHVPSEAQLTNFDTPSFRNEFKRMVIHPSFGLHWDEGPAPTMTNANALAGVEAFVATNGWNLQTNDCAFDCSNSEDIFRTIRGLPWTVIHDREFPAVTHNHVLYVMFTGWHHNATGVAYNPLTNAFAGEIQGFKPVGQHWYVWAIAESPVDFEKTYEGKPKPAPEKSLATPANTPPK